MKDKVMLKRWKLEYNLRWRTKRYELLVTVSVLSRSLFTDATRASKTVISSGFPPGKTSYGV